MAATTALWGGRQAGAHCWWRPWAQTPKSDTATGRSWRPGRSHGAPQARFALARCWRGRPEGRGWWRSPAAARPTEKKLTSPPTARPHSAIKPLMARQFTRRAQLAHNTHNVTHSHARRSRPCSHNASHHKVGGACDRNKQARRAAPRPGPQQLPSHPAACASRWWRRRWTLRLEPGRLKERRASHHQHRSAHTS